MSRVRFILPEVKSTPESRPDRCPYCKGHLLQRHGKVKKPVKDLGNSVVTVQRYLCTSCCRTFRHYPEGVDSHDQSQRLRATVALLWALGLSHQNISYLLRALGPSIAKMTSWRDVQEFGAAGGRSPCANSPVEVIGVDETVVKLKGQRVAIGFVIDPATGALIGLELLTAQDSTAFFGWLSSYVKELGVKVVVSDDLATYKPVAEQLGVAHQVCLAHVRKNVARRLREIEGWEQEKETIARLLKELPEGGGRQLLELSSKAAKEPKLRSLAVDLCERWRSLICYQRMKGVPRTNNATEQVIGRSKVRYKTVRGFKSIGGMLAGLNLTQWVWRPGQTRDLHALLAA